MRRASSCEVRIWQLRLSSLLRAGGVAAPRSSLERPWEVLEVEEGNGRGNGVVEERGGEMTGFKKGGFCELELLGRKRVVWFEIFVAVAWWCL